MFCVHDGLGVCMLPKKTKIPSLYKPKLGNLDPPPAVSLGAALLALAPLFCLPKFSLATLIQSNG